MAALPTTTTAFASGATEAQFKTFLTGQRDYLAGLFGTDGTAATAKSTLGVVAGVSSVNGNAGAVSAAQIAAAAVASWGYTPPNPSGLNADTVDGYHYNNLPYVPIAVGNVVGSITMTSGEAIGGLGIGQNSLSAANNTITISGGYATSVPGGNQYFTGTWVCIGIAGLNVLWRKIA